MTDTKAALDAALAKYNDVRTKAEAGIDKEQQLQQQYGRKLADGDKIAALSVRAELDRVTRANFDLVASLQALGNDVGTARAAHRVTVVQTLTPKIDAAAQSLATHAATFEAALAALVEARDGFVTAGATLRALAHQAGDLEPNRFLVAKLADDVIGHRLRPVADSMFSDNGPAYETAVSELIASTLVTAEVIL